MISCRISPRTLPCPGAPLPPGTPRTGLGWRSGFRALLGALALGLGFSLSLRAGGTERIALQLKWRHQFQFAGYYAAQAQGYYREAGLDVEIREASAGLDPIEEVAAGRAQYGVGNSALLLARQKGRPVVALAVVFQHSPFVLIARAEAGISSVHDLAGRRVMLERHPDELLAYLGKEGVPPSSLQWQEHSLDPSDLVQGRVDAVSAYSTDEPFLLDQAGLRYLMFTPRADGIDFYGDNLFTSEAELRDHPARARAFREASLRGWKQALAHPDETADLILARFSQGHSRDHLLFEARQMVPLIRSDLVALGYMHEGRWQHIADTYADLGLLQRPFNLQGFLYDPEAQERRLQHRMRLALIWALPIAAILGAATLAFLAVNRRLRQANRAQAELGAIIQENEQRFRFIAEHAADAIWTLDLRSGRFTYVSPSAQQLWGYTPEELMARPAAESLAPESAARVRGILLRSVAEWQAGRPAPPEVFELQQPHKDGHPVPTEVVATLHPGADGQPASILGISRDITERKRAEEQLRRELHSLEHLASTDPLTLAWNRRHFGEVVEGERHRSERYGHPLTLLLLDIDHFKRVNDAFGHAAGDRVLREVADCIRAEIRVSDSLTRWGGEEFIVLMPNTGLLSARTLAERILAGVEAHLFEGVGRVTVSIGLAEHLPGKSMEAWLERADQAMYLAKHKGRNRVEFDTQRRSGPAIAERVEGTFVKLVWNPVYQCGHALIDAQHERLFHLANDLLDAMLSERPMDELLPLVGDLLADVAQHFHDEEKLLRRLGYQALHEHADLHAHLLGKGLELRRGFEAGTLSPGSLFQFLAHDVVAQHMLKADRDFFHLIAQQN